MNLQALKRRYRAGEIDKPRFIDEALELHRQLFTWVDALQGTDVHEITVTPEGVSYVLGEHRIRLHCPPGEGRVAPLEALNFDRYEPFESRVMDLLCADARQILDVGASIGWHALRLARRFPRAQVHAFEPLPPAQAYLRRNVAANGLGERVLCHDFGLTEEGGTADFFVRPGHGTNASLRNVSGADDARCVGAEVRTLDAWARQQGVAPDFIKCDVEGAELLVLRGARQTLTRHRPAVLAELLRKWCRPFGHHPNDVLAWMAELGYEGFALGAAGVRPLTSVDDSTAETHFVFLHPARHGEAVARLRDLRNETP